MEPAVYGEVVLVAQAAVIILKPDDVQLVYLEIGYRRFQVERRRGGHGATADMGLHRHIVNARVVTDLFALGNAADKTDIRLDDVDGLVLEIAAVAWMALARK